ncbi:MAG: mechanosensitive ion channel [Campylobacterota bacterium]|nr:mechanosensitive ion channel [Campylobacterota bacterium]
MNRKLTRALLLLFLLLATVVNASELETEVKSVDEPVKEVAFIKVSDISESSVQTSLNLKTIREVTLKTKELKEIHESIPGYIDSIEIILNDSQYEDLESLNIRKLQQLRNELLIYLKSLTKWSSILRSNIEVYDKNKILLLSEDELWIQTKINADTQSAPEAILEQISSVNTEIEELKKSTKLDYDHTLTDLNSLTTNIIRIKDVIEKLKKNEIASSNQVFHQNTLPLFESFSDTPFSFMKYIEAIYETIFQRFNEAKHYFQTQLNQVYIFLVSSLLLSLFVFYFNYLYIRKKLFVKEESSYKKDFYFMKIPLTTIVMLLSLLVVTIFADSPKSVVQFVLLLILLPVFRILQTMIEKGQERYLYSFLFLYFLQLIHTNSTGYEIEGRVFGIILSIALVTYMFILMRARVLESFVNKFIGSFAYKILTLFILLCIVSIVSNIYGGVLLSYRINNGIFLSIYSALIFYTFYIVLTGYVIVIFRRRISSSLHMLDIYSAKIEHTTINIIKIIMFLWWLKIVAEQVSLYLYLINLKDKILTLSWEIASTTISVSSIVDFILIIFGTWVVSKVLITVLNVEIFARFTMPRGMPTAITTTLNYIIVITGGIIALSSLGVTPEQFTLVFGALGVGIGFGLRNIIANFVSGIIMVFERPVQIGDTIELNNTMGSVQSIGARSSTIKTFDGSEVIIPNADFIAKEITNWTLSDEFRRKTVVFKVDYNSDVEEVLSIMKTTAVNHPDVLKEPEPLAVFKGFGENYLEFKLYFWLSENLIVAQSEVSIGIYRALKKAGIKMPMPKQEMYIKNSDEEEVL